MIIMRTMKNGIVNIEVFEAMDTILEKHGRTATEWAEASWDNPKLSSRISELRFRVQMNRSGQTPNIGRAFSVKKCASLINGLQKLLGDEVVKKEIKKLLDKAKDSTERMILMILSLPKKDKGRIEKIMEALILKD